MSLKRQLERLSAGRQGLAPVNPTHGVTHGAPHLPAATKPSLDDLRAQMASILSRSSPPPAALRVPPGATEELTFEDLGFSLQENALGCFWRRKHCLQGSAHVGNVPITGVAAVDSRILALLARDPSLATCSPARALYLDTETTGLGGGAGVFAFLVGLLYCTPEGVCWDQLLLAGPEQEPALLQALSPLMADCELLVSFNGKAFDWPLIVGRYVMNGLPAPSPRPHLDLLHVARRIHAERVRSCTLKNLEREVLGFLRGEDIDGADVAQCYAHYLRTGNVSQVEAVLEHNRWDVLSMAALVALYGEPLPGLTGRDLVGFARTLLKSKALPEASLVVQRALEAGAGAQALKVRASINKALGDHSAALSDFEQVHAVADDGAVRLELAKLYEHRLRQPERALDMVLLGVAERPPAVERRRARLRRKIDRS